MPCQYSMGVYQSHGIGMRIIRIAEGEPLSGQAKEGIKY